MKRYRVELSSSDWGIVSYMMEAMILEFRNRGIASSAVTVARIWENVCEQVATQAVVSDEQDKHLKKESPHGNN